MISDTLGTITSLAFFTSSSQICAVRVFFFIESINNIGLLYIATDCESSDCNRHQRDQHGKYCLSLIPITVAPDTLYSTSQTQYSHLRSPLYHPASFILSAVTSFQLGGSTTPSAMTGTTIHQRGIVLPLVDGLLIMMTALSACRASCSFRRDKVE